MIHIGSLDLFRIGIGPSSSHTVGPMRAARAFIDEVHHRELLDAVVGVHVSLYGSLGATGAGHGTTNALVRGLAGDEPESCDPDIVREAFDHAVSDSVVSLLGHPVTFAPEDFSFHPLTKLPLHSNGMRFQALAQSGSVLVEAVYYSVGGGFIERGDDVSDTDIAGDDSVPYEFHSAKDLLALSHTHGLSIAEISLANDAAAHGEGRVADVLSRVWAAMTQCIERGLAAEGMLPGSLRVARRAHSMAAVLAHHDEGASDAGAEWLQTYAIAVNEENADGGRVVTAPTNGAAGIIPAVAYWAKTFKNISDQEITRIYLPTAAAIGSLYKRNASISGAEAGCQGEVGSACSMAAAGITAVMGGTPEQIENAAEIAMEHNLGLTCDPVGGFVQMPCIERNAIAAGTAVAAMRLALMGDGAHKISLDTVIETMRQTGIDMSHKYKETSMGGLAVNVVEC